MQLIKIIFCVESGFHPRLSHLKMKSILKSSTGNLNIRSRAVSNPVDLVLENEKRKSTRIKGISSETRVNVNDMDLINIQVMIYCTKTNIVLSEESTLDSVYEKICSKMKILFGILIDSEDIELQTTIGGRIGLLEWEDLKQNVQIYLHVAFTNTSVFKLVINEMDYPKHSELISMLARKSATDNYISMAIFFPEKQKAIVFTPRDVTIDKVVENALKAGRTLYDFQGKKYEFGLSLKQDSYPIANTIRLKDLKSVLSFTDDGQCPELFLQKIKKVRKDAIDMMINVPNPLLLSGNRESFDESKDDRIKRSDKSKIKSMLSLAEDPEQVELHSIPFFVEFVLPKAQTLQVLCNTGWTIQELKAKIEKTAKAKLYITLNCGGFNFEVGGKSITEPFLYENEDIKRLVGIGKKFTIALVKKELSMFPAFKDRKISRRMSESDFKKKQTTLRSGISDAGIGILIPDRPKIWKSIAKIARNNAKFIGLRDTFIEALYVKLDAKIPAFFNVRDTFLFDESFDVFPIDSAPSEQQIAENKISNDDILELIAHVKFIQVSLLGQIPFNFPLDEEMTEEDVRKKAISKISKLLSQQLQKDDLLCTTSTKLPFEINQVLVTHQFIIDCLKSHTIPTLTIESKISSGVLYDAVKNVTNRKTQFVKRSNSQDSIELEEADARYDRILEFKKILVKVKLPQNINTNLILSKYSDFSAIIDKSNTKISSLLGQHIDPAFLDIVAEYGMEIFDPNCKVLECQYVRNCIKHNIDPCFIIKLKSTAVVKPSVRLIFNNKSIQVEDEVEEAQPAATGLSKFKTVNRTPIVLTTPLKDKISVEAIYKEIENNKLLANYGNQGAQRTSTSLTSISSRVTISHFEDLTVITTIVVDSYMSLLELKKYVVGKVDNINKLGQYTFKYLLQGATYEFVDDSQILQTTNLYKNDQNPTLLLCMRKQHIIGPLEKKIASLMGVGVRKYELFRSDVYPILRRKLLSLCKENEQQRDYNMYHYSPEVDFSTLPNYCQVLIKENPTMQIRIFSSTGPGSFKTVNVTPFERPLDVVVKYLTKTGVAVTTSNNYILVDIASGEYIYGDYPLISFSWFKNALFKHQMVELVIKSNSQITTTPSNIQDELVDDSRPYIQSHNLLTLNTRKLTELNELKFISMWDILAPIRFKIMNFESPLPIKNVNTVYISTGLYFGGELLCPVIDTNHVPYKNSTTFNMWLNFELNVMNMPKNTRACITIHGKMNNNEIIALGWVNILLIDFKSQLLQGKQSIRTWPNEKGNPIGTVFSSNDKEHGLLNLKFQEYALPVVCPDFEGDGNVAVEVDSDTKFAIPNSELKLVEDILKIDSLTKLTKEQQSLLWRYRYCIIDKVESLPKLVRCTQWNDLSSVLEMKRILLLYGDIPTDIALGLLDSYVSDSDIRAFAVYNLQQHLGDVQLIDLMLQLTQALKYEPRLDSELARFLLKRAVLNKSIGHRFFWYLKADIHRPDVSTLFGILIECYLLASPDHMEELVRQNNLILQIDDTAMVIKKTVPVDRNRVLRNMLGGIKLPTGVGLSLPLNPKLTCGGINLAKCKVMDSKKLPLWITFDHSERYGQEIPIIYKSGDDLRQDMLTLQMLRLMDKAWHNEGLDMRLAPYGCLSTGLEMGLIEVVINSMTVSGIQTSLGGSRAAFKEDPLDQWLRQQNPEEKEYLKAVEMFTLSCAGYCVATYCLGIGDRHNDNIMLCKDGRLFHIDFGHFLGNIKRKFGIKRERAPFVLTPDFIYIIGKKDSPNFNRFIDLCIKAYIIIRRQANMFINLFAMVIKD